MAGKRNRLAQESSPYLLQHQDNPVDWFPWGEEALSLAKKTGKPILLSVGYSSCHWCHVMAHESFEDADTAKIMNDLFINIKVDREERPDIDDIYMEAVQVMGINGGWPLTVFLTPDLKPFYGGTYFPPVGKYGQPAFTEVLQAVSTYFKDNKEEATSRADSIVKSLNSHSEKLSLKHIQSNPAKLSYDDLVQTLNAKHQDLLSHLNSEFDSTNGGFGRAPKFPQPSKIAALLFSSDKKHHAEVLLTLDKIRCGGITDQLGGGVCRYSVDAIWLVPHFEKMLYDNAQLIYQFAAASHLAHNDEMKLSFQQMSRDVFNYFETDLKAPSGLYYCAEDADSEGHEGKFYVFSQTEIDSCFSDSEFLKNLAIQMYGVSKEGNFEGKNILTLPSQLSLLAHRLGTSEEEFRVHALAVRKRLLAVRNKRTRPSRDEKCLLSWNALTATGLIKTGIYLNDSAITSRGLDLVKVCLNEFKNGKNYFHTINGSEKKIHAFCDDIAYLMEACCEALLLTGCKALKDEFINLARIITDDFLDSSTGCIYFSRPSDDLVMRPHRPEDNVLYSAHAAIIYSTQAFSCYLDNQHSWDDVKKVDKENISVLSLVAVSNIFELAKASPIATARSLTHIDWISNLNLIYSHEVATLDEVSQIHCEILKKQKPKTLVGNKLSDFLSLEDFPLFVQAQKTITITYSLCSRRGCQLPTASIDNLLKPI